MILITLACIAISYFAYMNYRRWQMLNAFPGPIYFPLIGTYYFLQRSIDGNKEKNNNTLNLSKIVKKC